MSDRLQKRNEDMAMLRFRDGLTLRKIGEIYGITRERVSQIIGNTGYDFIKKWTENRAKNIDLSRLNSGELRDLPGHLYVYKKEYAKIHHKNNGISYQSEVLVSSKLAGLGYPNKIKRAGHPYDIELDNGTRIDVKHTDHSHKYYRGQVSPGWRFVHFKRGVDCDFFICVIPSGEMFVIPSSETVRNTYIVIMWPQTGQKKSKWAKFYNRFDLLGKESNGAR